MGYVVAFLAGLFLGVLVMSLCNAARDTHDPKPTKEDAARLKASLEKQFGGPVVRRF
jgi:uncharacterized membrane-anchored protein YhcB (DUF1043 family)